MEQNVQTALALVRDAGQLPVTWNTLEECEHEIIQWKNTIGLGVCRIGQALLWAKDRVPHGQWGDWLREKVDFSPSTAQNFMRIAREVTEGSSLVKLPYTKILALLELPASERESFAEEIGAEDRSAAEIRRLIREKEELEKRHAQQTLAMRGQLEEAEHRADRAVTANSLQVEKLQQQRAELETAREEAKKALRARDKVLDSYTRETEKLKRRIEELQNQPPTIVHEEPADYQALKAALARVTEEKDRAEREADRLADELDRAKLGEARQESGSPATRILSAIGGMIAMVGRDPGILMRDPAVMSREDWRMVLDKVAVVYSWCQSMDAVARKCGMRG